MAANGTSLRPSREALRGALRIIYDTHAKHLDREVIDEMAIRSYLEGLWLSRIFFWGKLERIVEAAGLRPGQHLFDFGCGSGILLPTWKAGKRTVWATDLVMDLSRTMADHFRLDQIKFVSSDDWPTSIPDGSLDVVVAANVLEHIADRKELLRRFAQKLKAGGTLVISGPTENALYRLGRRLIGFSGHYHESTIADILKDVDATEYEPTRRVSYPFSGPLCLYQIASYRVR